MPKNKPTTYLAANGANLSLQNITETQQSRNNRTLDMKLKPCRPEKHEHNFPSLSGLTREKQSILLQIHQKKMGCGESKHDVATGNTVTLKKSDTGSKNSKGTDDFIEAASNDHTNTNASVQYQEREINGGKGTEDGHNVKDITEDMELKGGENKTVASELARFISKESPNHFFSSRKDEEAIDAEGRSEKSEYCSPRHEAGKESLFNDNVEADIAVEEKLIEQSTGETAKGEDVNVKEENLAKEPEASTAIEAEVTTFEEKKDFSTEKEITVESQNNEMKTT